MKRFIPPHLLRLVRSTKQRVRRLRKSITNSARAFNPTESGYRLAIGRFGCFDVAFREGTADELVIRHSFEHDIFFPGVPEYIPGPGDVIIDIGAHIGTFAMLAATRVPQGRVYAIEASTETFNYLRVNKALNRLENLEVSHLALSDRSGSTVLYHDEGSWEHTIMKKRSSVQERVPTETLPTYMRQWGIDRCNFVKFNCEGAEFPILMRMTADDLRLVGAMLVLYHCDLVERYNLSMLIRHLEASGFRTMLRNQTEQRGWIVALRGA